MTHLILFQDNPNAPADVRAKHMQAHLSFLEAASSKIEAAGPLFTTNGVGAGGAWLVNGSADEAEALIHADPFWPTGLRDTHQVLEWRKVFAGGRRLILP